MRATPHFPPIAPDFAPRLTTILLALAALIARAFLRNPCRAWLILPLWSRLTRAARRFESLAARLAAGIQPRAPRPGRPSGAPLINLPTTCGWLVTDLRHEAVAYALHLEALIAEPANAAFLAATPAAARILRPLCRMLGVAVEQPSAPPPPPARIVEPAPPSTAAPNTRGRGPHPPHAPTSAGPGASTPPQNPPDPPRPPTP